MSTKVDKSAKPTCLLLHLHEPALAPQLFSALWKPVSLAVGFRGPPSNFNKFLQSIESMNNDIDEFYVANWHEWQVRVDEGNVLEMMSASILQAPAQTGGDEGEAAAQGGAGDDEEEEPSRTPTKKSQTSSSSLAGSLGALSSKAKRSKK